jgi:hypothetical protein
MNNTAAIAQPRTGSERENEGVIFHGAFALIIAVLSGAQFYFNDMTIGVMKGAAPANFAFLVHHVRIWPFLSIVASIWFLLANRHKVATVYAGAFILHFLAFIFTEPSMVIDGLCSVFVRL